MEEADAAVLLQRHARGRVVRHTLQLHAEAQAEFENLEAVQRAKQLLMRYFDREFNTAAGRLQRQWRKRRSRRRPARMRAVTLITPGTPDAAAFAATSGRCRAASHARSPGALLGLEVNSRRKNSMEVAIEELAAQRRQAMLERSSQESSGRQRAMTHSGDAPSGIKSASSGMTSGDASWSDTASGTRKRSASGSAFVELGDVRCLAAPAETAPPAATPAAAPAAAPPFATLAAMPAPAPCAMQVTSMSSSLSNCQVGPGCSVRDAESSFAGDSVPGWRHASTGVSSASVGSRVEGAAAPAPADRGIGGLALVGGGIHGAIPEDSSQRATARNHTGDPPSAEGAGAAEMKLELTSTLLKRSQHGTFQPRVFSLHAAGEGEQRQVELAYTSNKRSRDLVRLGRVTNARATDVVKREFCVSLAAGFELRLRANTISQMNDWMQRFPSQPESVPELDAPASAAKPVRRTWLGRAPKVRAAHGNASHAPPPSPWPSCVVRQMEKGSSESEIAPASNGSNARARTNVCASTNVRGTTTSVRASTTNMRASTSAATDKSIKTKLREEDVLDAAHRRIRL